MKEELKTGDFVIPGEFLATAEEFIPGEGAYEEKGDIYSASTGVVLTDDREKRITVHQKTSMPPEPEPDDIVIGRVDRVRGQVANLTVGILRGREDRQLPSSGDAIIHISKVSDDYIEELEEQFKPGDIVRAKVLSTNRGSMRLSTVGDSLGVLVALCSKCRTVLEEKDSKLKCPSCGNIETRKIPKDYRQGIL
ncbi:MAG: exosome complex RNA-binding protein Csl4 [Hadesarchaea archaeon]|nr:exosome complex RNA-binding protein Csl4 [Hadesarchaea archaeon]